MNLTATNKSLMHSTKIAIDDILLHISLTQDSVVNPASNTSESHFHAQYEVHYIISGKFIFQFENETICAEGNTLVIIPPNELHSVYGDANAKNNKKLCFELSISKHTDCGQLYEEYSALLACITTHFIKHTDMTLFHHLNEAFCSNSEIISHYKTNAFFTMLFFEIMELLQNKQPFRYHFLLNDNSEIRISELLSFIQENYSRSITLSDIATSCNLSKKQVERLIKKYMNSTFTTVLNSYRIQISKQEISKMAAAVTATETLLSNIAFSVGFNSYNYFYTQFKKIEGMTPLEFLKVETERHYIHQ